MDSKVQIREFKEFNRYGLPVVLDQIRLADKFIFNFYLKLSDNTERPIFHEAIERPINVIALKGRREALFHRAKIQSEFV